MLTGFIATLLYYQFGLGVPFFIWSVFVAALIVITFIDLNERIIPDEISKPGILLGFSISVADEFLVVDTSGLIPTPFESVLGILAGYGFLWTIAWIYERCTGIEGLGRGDMKLLAMFGAFLGWQALPLTIFLGSFVGSVVGLGIMFATGADRRLPLPFGPFLCFAATVHLFFGRELFALYFG
jgi:leader peptidase (prepilin peptidase)/N-methyltransferase